MIKGLLLWPSVGLPGMIDTSFPCGGPQTVHETFQKTGDTPGKYGPLSMHRL